jgi:hypothetical protein
MLLHQKQRQLLGLHWLALSQLLVQLLLHLNRNQQLVSPLLLLRRLPLQLLQQQN